MVVVVLSNSGSGGGVSRGDISIWPSCNGDVLPKVMPVLPVVYITMSIAGVKTLSQRKTCIGCNCSVNICQRKVWNWCPHQSIKNIGDVGEKLKQKYSVLESADKIQMAL